MRFKSFFRGIPLAALLIGGAMFSSPRAVVAATAQEQVMAEAVTTELRELRDLTNQLAHDGDRLQALTGSRLQWQTHAAHLSAVREDINRVGEQLGWLQNMRFSAAPWQQEAIDAIVPVAVQVASRTSAAIEHLNSDRQTLWAPHYIDHLRTTSALTGHMHDLLDNHLKIADARERLGNIQGELAERIS